MAVELALSDWHETKLNLLVSQMKVEELEEDISHYSLRSPINGIVEKLTIETGESFDNKEAHIRIVRLNPLWVEVQVDRKIAVTLSKNSKHKLVFDDGKEHEAIINFISPLTDTASDTVRLRLEVVNSQRRLAGEKVSVYFK